jgi:hypothetical protein
MACLTSYRIEDFLMLLYIYIVDSLREVPEGHKKLVSRSGTTGNLAIVTFCHYLANS